MRGVAENLQTSLRRSALLHHALTKGEIREQDVIEAFRPLLPRRYELSSGVVVNSSGAQSQQQDLILSDSYFVPPFLTSGGMGVHPIETVAGVFEIKSRGDANAIRDGVGKIASVKELSSDQPRGVRRSTSGSIAFYEEVVKPFGAIVCLESQGSRDNLLAAYIETITPLPAVHRPNALLVLDDFTALWQTNKAGEHSFLTRPDGADRLVEWDVGPNSLLLFYLVVLAALRAAPEPELDLSAYLEGAEIRAEGRWFQLREGNE